MEIKLDSILKMNAWQLSHSAFEGGPNAAKNTWCVALRIAEDTPLLDTEEKLQSMRAFAVSSGGWNREEVSGWDSLALNALFLQWVAGDCRELGADSLSEIDWEEIESDIQEGFCSVNLFKGIDGSVYFYLGS